MYPLFSLRSASLFAACTFWTVLPTSAHDIVLQPQVGGLAVRYGHPQDWQPLELNKLARVKKAGSDKLVAVNTTRVMLPEAEFVSNNLKFAKALLPSAADEGLYMRRVGHLLELVPQRNPATLKAGELLPVLVLFKGQPLAGAGIEVGNLFDAVPEDQIRRYTTDAQGIAQVTLRDKGVNMLGVDLERPNDGSLGEAAKKVGADKFVLVATYTFLR